MSSRKRRASNPTTGERTPVVIITLGYVGDDLFFKQMRQAADLDARAIVQGKGREKVVEYALANSDSLRLIVVGAACKPISIQELKKALNEKGVIAPMIGIAAGASQEDVKIEAGCSDAMGVPQLLRWIDNHCRTTT